MHLALQNTCGQPANPSKHSIAVNGGKATRPSETRIAARRAHRLPVATERATSQQPMAPAGARDMHVVTGICLSVWMVIIDRMDLRTVLVQR